jgi:hypothetical protein
MTRCLWAILLVLTVSCDSKKEAKPEAVARVGGAYLYKSELKGLVPAGTSRNDSIAIVRSFIDRWATRRLLIDAAEVNLSEDKKAQYDVLVRQYKVDLYTKAYIEDIVKTTVDTAVAPEELEAYFKSNRDNFRTTGTLVRLRYAKLHKENPKYEAIRRKFFDYGKSDAKFWETHKLQLTDYAFNDSVWVEMPQVYSRLPFINPDNRERYISAGKAIQESVGNEVYLVKITGVIDKDQIAPFDYLKPTLREVILNKRKLELIKKFEKEITDDAIKDNNYEIYK